MNEAISTNQGISTFHAPPRIGVPLTYMPIFEPRVVFGILGDVEGFPLTLKRTKSLPRQRIIIVFFKSTC